MKATVAEIVSVGCCVVVLALAGSPTEGQTVPGEKWRQEIKVSMDGMTMPMGKTEICAPVGQTDALLKPDENCQASNVRVVGDTTSADITCTGRDAMSGSVKLTAAGDTVSGTAQMKTSDGEQMTLVMKSTRLGTCQAIDTGALVATAEAKAKAAAQTFPDVCATAVKMVEQDAAKAGGMAQFFTSPDQPCASKPAHPVFCKAIQTRPGFSSLLSVQEHFTGIAATSVAACGLGQGDSGIESLRAKLVREAETEGDGHFLISQAPDRARALARSECVIKGEMWGGKTPKWDNFCDSNFAAEARGGN